MKHLDIQTNNGSQFNIDALYKIAPSCFTEAKDDKGNVRKVVDFTKLRLLLGDNTVEDAPEVYDFTWVGKRAALQEAAAPIRKTLRPYKEESLDWDTTQNLYIEGDNLEVLKLIQNSYMGKVKMIYIDPPYNTGNDFVYHDDFAQRADDYNEHNIDEEGNRFRKNTDSNGRFHSDWCSMIYARLMVARSLLKDDGLIFISINDKEIHNLKKICAEIFGEANEIATLIWDKNHSAQAGIYKVYHEYIIVYAKNISLIEKSAPVEIDIFEAGAMKKISGRHPASEFIFPAGTRVDAPDGTEFVGTYGETEKVEVTKGRFYVEGGKLKEDVTLKAGFTQMNQMKQFFYGDRESLVDTNGQKILEFYFNSTGKIKIVKQRGVDTPQTTCKFGTQGAASTELASLFELEECPFSSPKPVDMLMDFIIRFTKESDIILDFFSGSSTTAHALFKANCKTESSKRRFIMVQLAEDLDESLKHAQKDAVRTLQVAIEFLDKIGKPHTICEIGKERIRRAGKIIKEENPDAKDLDIGFRVFKCEDSNYKDVAFAPKDYTQDMLAGLLDNIKEDRNDLDLLFDCMLRWGVELSLPLESTIVDGCTIHNVNEGDLVGCFEGVVTEKVIDAIAAMDPVRVVFRDSSFTEAANKMNLFELFKQKGSWTDEEVKKNVRVI